MKERGVKQPCDQRPYLFGVPSPITSKGLLGINSTGNHADGQKRKTIHERIMIDHIQCLQGGQSDIKRAEFLFFDMVFLDEIHNRRDEGKGENTVSGENRPDMNSQPHTSENGFYRDLNCRNCGRNNHQAGGKWRKKRAQSH